MQRRAQIVSLPVKSRLRHGLVDPEHHGKHPPAHPRDKDINLLARRIEIQAARRRTVTVVRATGFRPRFVDRATAGLQHRTRRSQLRTLPVVLVRKRRAMRRRSRNYRIQFLR